MTRDQAWATARVLTAALKKDHYVVAFIARQDDFLALDEEQYNVLRGRNWLRHFEEQIKAA